MTQDMIELPERAPMSEYQRYIHELEALHGWLDVDLVHNCFLMGEEVGELFKAIRKHQRMFESVENPEDKSQPPTPPDAAELETTRAQVAEELVDVMNYVMALANRLEIDLEAAFRKKNAYNQTRTWGGA